MKKVFYVFATAVVMVACAKEWPWADKAQTGITRSAQDGCYELFVSIDGLTDEAGKPVGESIETKAAINETDGHFTWTAGDVIDVVTSSGVYQFVAAESGAKARFVYDGDDFTGEPLSVEYPSTNSTTPAALPTAITGNTGALSSDNLRLTGNKFDGNNVNVHHKNALVRLEFHDVPTFASKLVFDGNVNDVTVTFTPLVSRGKIVVYVPVDVATTSFSVSLRDDNNNEIVSKSTTSAKSFTAGTLKVMASVAVEGWVFQANGASSIDQLRFCKRYNDVTYDEEGSRYNAVLNVLADGTTKWAILPSSAGNWVGNHYPIALKALNGGSEISHTDCIYLCRDFVFDLSESSLKTDYRIYPHGGSYSSPHMYASRGTGTYDTPSNITFNVSQSGTQWSNLYWYADNGSEKPSGDWPGTKFSGSFTIPATKVYGKTIIIVIHNGGGGNPNQTKDLVVDCSSSPNNHLSTVNIELNSSWDKSNDNKRYINWTSTTFASEILETPFGADPGVSFTSPESITGAAGTFLSFGTSYYGDTFDVVFSDNGSSAKPTWVITINREYDYGL